MSPAAGQSRRRGPGRLATRAAGSGSPAGPSVGRSVGPEARLAGSQLGPGLPEQAHEAPERGDRAVGQRVEQHHPPLQEVAKVVGVLGVALPPGAVQGAAVVVRHVGGDQHDIGAVGLQELGQGLVVGPRGLHRADDLGDPGLGLAPLQVRPEGCEAGLHVGDDELQV